MDLMRLITHDYSDTKELTTDELKTLILELIDIDEVPFALGELHSREEGTAIELGKNILEKNLGDVFLQAAVFDYIFKEDKQYTIDYIERHLKKMDTYMFTNMLDRLLEVSNQEYGLNIPDTVLRDIVETYTLFSLNERNTIADKYDLFLSAYFSK